MKLLKLWLGGAGVGLAFLACGPVESDDGNENACLTAACDQGSGGAGTGAAPGTGAVPGTGGLGQGAMPGSGGLGQGAAPGTGGLGQGAAPGTGGQGQGATGSGGGEGGPLGGYHVNGDWAGFAFTFATEATITPMSFETMVDMDGPYCVNGTVSATEEYTSIAAFGVNFNQDKVQDAEVKTMVPQGDGLMIDLTVANIGAQQLRVQLEDLTDPSAPDAAEHRWCANIPAESGQEVIPWASFNTECWDNESGTDFDPSTPLAKAIVYVPDPGPMGSDIPFDFCVNDIGPTNVPSRGTGAIVASCGNNVSWGTTSTSDPYANVASSDNQYQFQSNGWNWVNGGHSISLLSGGGFRMDSQTCSSSDSKPCSFPSVYIGTDADGNGKTTGNGLPAQISNINSVPTCMGWNSGGTPPSDEYNVSFDVWFNSNPGATYAETFLMLWYRDPPSFQPGGMFPTSNGTVIGDQTWQVWIGPNADGQTVISYVSPNPLADGMAYSFDLKDFIDDAVERDVLSPSQHLISVMAGMEIWNGANGAAITDFMSTVQ